MENLMYLLLFQKNFSADIFTQLQGHFMYKKSYC